MRELSYDYGLWSAVIFNVLFFLIFVVSFLTPKKRRDWRSLGVFMAFIVALFVEMYGFPLTIYILVSTLGSKFGLINPFGHLSGHLWGTLLGAPDWAKVLICQIGSLFMITGLVIMGIAWRKIHGAQGQLVTDGIYSYVRHPQYSGLFMIILGMMIQWPTFATLLMWPVLMITYYRLAKKEEGELEKQFGEEYIYYKVRAAAFVPSRWKLSTLVGMERRES